MIKVSRVEVIYQSRGPSLRAVKHESSGGGGGGGGGVIKEHITSERGPHLYVHCVSTLRARGPCHDVKTLMD